MQDAPGSAEPAWKSQTGSLRLEGTPVVRCKFLIANKLFAVNKIIILPEERESKRSRDPGGYENTRRGKLPWMTPHRRMAVQ